MKISVGGPVEGTRPLSWSRTVARELVHRTSVAEVLLTDVRRLADGRYVAAACWPRSHPTFPRDGDGRHSPLMVVETLRQLGIYIPLRYFAVSADAHALITDLRYAIDPMTEPRAESGATGVTCLVRASEVRRASDGTVFGLRLHVSCLAGGVLFARAGGGARFLDPVRYEAVREGRAHGAAPLPARSDGRARPDPRRVGAAGPRDLVIRTDGGRAGGRPVLVEPVDPHHPFFFDHPTDHVPGMVLLEAARQAAAFESGGVLLRPTAGRLTAARFVEYRPPARVLCVPRDTACAFRFLQDGQQKAFGVLRYENLNNQIETLNVNP
ncbi:ScbA/BarX family gamma-butyrolactone biosynthesis protein [Streptomyces hebeiensis]|uniref:ScbA/BarX family gamma-butyrolactone biosynthesis protein n=1 Tax=Streptomyces hebeiensis TaxID=229486 RepID=UPI0031CE1A79